MNNGEFVNINEITEERLEKELLEKLKALFSEIPWLNLGTHAWTMRPGRGNEAGDASLVVNTQDGQRFSLLLDCRKHLRPSSFPVIAQRRNEKPFPVNYPCLPVLGVPYISPRMADLCKEAGWGWIDLSGNCCIDIENIAHIERSGNPRIHKRSAPLANLSTPEAARILRVLLEPCHTGLSFTQRELKERCEPQVSIGLVNKVVKYLKNEAYLKPNTGYGGFKLTEPRALLEAWRELYRYDRHQRLSMFTLLKGKRLHAAFEKLNKLAKGKTAFASFSAAIAIAPHVRQSKTWLYVTERDLELLTEVLEAKEVDSGDNLQVLIPEDSGVFYQTNDSWKLMLNTSQAPYPIPMVTTSMIQTYLDLWHAGGRGQEAAEALLLQSILPLWENFGMSNR